MVSLFSIQRLIFKCYIFRLKDFKNDSMPHHKRKPPIPQIGRPVAYSPRSVCPPTLPPVLHSGVTDITRGLLMSLYQTQFIWRSSNPAFPGELHSGLPFNQGAHIILKSWPFWNSPWITCLVYGAFVFSELRIFYILFPSSACCNFSKAFQLALIFTHNQEK